MGCKFSDDEEIEEDVETEVEEIEYSERDMHRTGIDPELVIENFKEFFNKMTYEEREAYLKRMGFSFGDECGSSDEDLEV